jgi:hypothetical protein
MFETSLFVGSLLTQLETKHQKIDDVDSSTWLTLGLSFDGLSSSDFHPRTGSCDPTHLARTDVPASALMDDLNLDEFCLDGWMDGCDTGSRDFRHTRASHL